MPIGLPEHVRVHRKGGPTIVDLGRSIVADLGRLAPPPHLPSGLRRRQRDPAGDGHERFHVTARIRRAAAHRQAWPTPARRGTGCRHPPGLAAQATCWTTVAFGQRGTEVTRQVWSRTLVWYGVTTDT